MSSSTGVSSSIEKGGVSASASTCTSSTSSSISPVASAGLTFSGVRRTTAPRALSTNSGRRRMRDRVRLRVLRVKDELDESRAIAQVDEDDAAVVAATVNPAGDAHRTARVLGPSWPHQVSR